MKLRPLLLACIGFAPVALVAVVSAQTPKKSVPVAPSATQAGNVVLRGENSVYDDTTGIGRLTGNVTISQTGQDLILYAQQLVYNYNKDQGIATGQLRIETRSSTIRGARLFADFNTKIATITSNVVVTTHGKRDGIIGNRQDLRARFGGKPTRITCDRADWDYEERQATLTGNIRMTQGENSGTCERILYDEERNVVSLVGRVRFTDKQNRTFNAPNLTFYVDSGSIETSGGVLTIPRTPAPGAPTRPAKTPILSVKPAPVISNDDFTSLNMTPPPIPTPRPEPTEAPVPTPRPDDEETPTPAAAP